MDSSKQRRDVYLTGFGKFGNIRENPTTHLVHALTDDDNVTAAVVLETSATGSLEMLGPLRSNAEERNRPCIFLHLGVNENGKVFGLERVGYNLANFRIPDERGWVAKDEIIDRDAPDFYETALPLDNILAKLKECTTLVDISTDPGRYICNYVYFHSLRWVNLQAQHSGEQSHFALFVHVPPFNVISMDEQLKFIRQILDVVSSI